MKALHYCNPWENTKKKFLFFLPIFLTNGFNLFFFLLCLKVPRPLNIILMISDGCGYNCLDLASFYQHGRIEAQICDSFPVRFSVSTHSAPSTPCDPQKAWASFDLVLSDPADSAGAATAMAICPKPVNP